MIAQEASQDTWETARLALAAAGKGLAASPAGIARQVPFGLLLEAEIVGARDYDLLVRPRLRAVDV